MRVRRAVASSLLGTLFAVGIVPASAEEGDEPTVPPTRQLSELAASVAAEIEAITSPPPLADTDRDAWVSMRASRADLFSGSIRVAAAQRVRGLFPQSGLTVHGLIAGGSASLLARSEREGPTVRWDMEQASLEWARIESLLDELRRLVAANGPERMCPVSGVVDFEDDWHDHRPWGRAHKGNDLHGDLGAPLVALEAGVVVQANWHWSGGRQIYVRADSTGDVYYYAHLDSWEEWIWTGTRLEVGDVIGTLGQSGNAHTPHLHFGWMPGSWDLDLSNLQNPYELLVELCV